MKLFKKIQISGFRRLLDIDINIKPIMVMIGANGIGKTSILEAFSLLAASASGNLNAKMNELGGINSLVTCDKAENMSFVVDMEVPNYEPLKYELTVAPRGTSFAIELETLSQKRSGYPKPFKHIDSHLHDITYFDPSANRLVRPTWVHNPFETSLSQVPKMFQEPEEFRLELGSSTLYHVLNVDSRAPIRLPQQMKPANLPGKDGEDIIPFLYYLRETDADRFESIEDTLKVAFPGFENLNFPPVAAGMLSMTWKDKNFTKPLYMHQLSEGTLRFLWLSALLQSPGLTTITMIDEPEVSLHPELLSLFVDLIREASQRTHIIIATHSDRLVKFLKPDEVVVMDMNDAGFASAKWSDTLDLNAWLEEYSLDEVWRMGRMGGRG
ncbi:MAG TPA: ABC transporter ATP-binding protein [Nitrospiraceae bacterium]|nr:ABC transporter ATP-binding protein [Nitrospiraceae bacterium]